MDHPRKNWKTKHDDRIILHFDLDCFYAQVYENKTPSLKSLPLGIRQKSLLATCNYPARHLGIKKLMSISSALAICPDLVIVDGEDLTPFRDVSKRLYGLLRSYSWNDRVERLGLDEVWMDVTDVIEYNVELLNRNDLEHSWFCLDREDPERGFGFDARGFGGRVYGGDSDADHFGAEEGSDGLRTKLLIASHLAFHLRMKIEEEGYTTACGVSTNKLLAKLVGNVNKPRNQTTLLSCGRDGEETVQKFMGGHQLRKVPGVGGKTAGILSEYFVSQSKSAKDPKSVTVADLLSLHNPPLTPSLLSSLLSSSSITLTTSSARDLLSLLHGHDSSLVKPARLLPTQISIEDTYQFKPLTSVSQIRSELVKIAASLLRRMKTDLLTDDDGNKRGGKWMAKPRTLRLTTRPRVDPKDGRGYGYLRVSKSGPLPTYVFSITNPSGDDGEHSETGMVQKVVERLVTETLLPMFHQLNPLNSKEKMKGYSIGLLNVCVTNMDSMEMPNSGGGGRDIKDMFMRQREFTVYDHSEDHSGGGYGKDEEGKHDGTAQHERERSMNDMEADVDMDEDEDVDGEVRNMDDGHGTTFPTENTGIDKDIAHYQHHDPGPNDYEEDSMLPTSTNDYFHIEDDDEVWDDDPDEENDRWDDDNYEAEAEAINYNYDYITDPGGITGMSRGSEGGDGIKCPLCNHFIPLFALAAHERFHSMEGNGD